MGTNPIPVLTLHNGPGVPHFYFECMEDFLPQAGVAKQVRWPRAPFVRVDAGIESGDSVPVHYDPILGKIAAVGPDRATALSRLRLALDGSMVHGVVTNLPFLRALTRAREVESATADTEWIEREFLAGFAALASAPAPDLALAAAAIAEAGGFIAAASVPGEAPGGGARGEAREASSAFRSGLRWRLPGLD